jgi:hypothetical protein
MFLPYAVEDNIERKKTELNVVLNESLNTVNKHFVAGHHVVHFCFLQNQDLFQDLSTEM